MKANTGMSNNTKYYIVTIFAFNDNKSAVSVAVVLFINLIHLLCEGIIYIKHLCSY